MVPKVLTVPEVLVLTVPGVLVPKVPRVLVPKVLVLKVLTVPRPGGSRATSGTRRSDARGRPRRCRPAPRGARVDGEALARRMPRSMWRRPAFG